MGAGSSIFRSRAAGYVHEGDVEVPVSKERVFAVRSADEGALNDNVSRKDQDGKDDRHNDRNSDHESGVETSDAIEAVHDILQRLAQAHPTQTAGRWDLITEKVNRAMRRRHISSQPLKALLAKEGLTIPKCWSLEREQRAEIKKLAREERAADEGERKGKVGYASFGKIQGATEAPKADKTGAVPEESGESDTEGESDIEEENGESRDADSTFIYTRLSKYEVFSFMRLVHDRVGLEVIKEEHAITQMERAEAMVNKLFERLPPDKAKLISQQNRKRDNLRDDSLVYGEVALMDFLKVMTKLKVVHGQMMQSGGSFWDLGAGVGKLVIAAAMMHSFESCYGVEILDDLRLAARPILDRWRKEEAEKISPAKAQMRVDFMFADLMKREGWVTEATLLFVHTNLSATNLQEIRQKASNMKVETRLIEASLVEARIEQVGAICLSVSQAAVDDDKWGLLAVERISTSWGTATLYIHEKLED